MKISVISIGDKKHKNCKCCYSFFSVLILEGNDKLQLEISETKAFPIEILRPFGRVREGSCISG